MSHGPFCEDHTCLSSQRLTFQTGSAPNSTHQVPLRLRGSFSEKPSLSFHPAPTRHHSSPTFHGSHHSVTADGWLYGGSHGKQ